MTNMRSNFKLWPVGQGLFYTGEIKSEGKAFNFVYDCGGNESIITKMVDKYIPYSDKYIDMLVISHFDNDHINGLPLLLKKVNKINKLFIPYCGDIASYLLLVSYIYGNGSSFSNKINDIILVRTSELEEENRLIDFEELRLENVLDETYRIDNIRVSTMDTSSSSINLRAIWQFKLYNTFLKGKISVDIIKQKIDKLITEKKCTSLGELLLNHLDDIINDLKDIYKPYVSSNLRNSKHNQASLCLYHSPLVRIYNYEVGCVPKQTFKEFMEGKKLGCPLYFKCYSSIFSLNERVGTMLTGDISLRVNKLTKKYDHFRNYFSSEKDKVLFFLVPHHGAVNNWNPAILKDFKKVNFFLNSAGLNNGYGHPDGDVIREIVSTGASFLWANENNLVEYFIYYWE